MTNSNNTTKAIRSGFGSQDRLGLMQHKEEAWWFYRYLSLVYDRFVNPSHWTKAMRTQSLAHASLNHSELDVLDVGGGTGFCTEGILECGIEPQHVTLLDQSPHQMRQAKKKPHLAHVKLVEGDAEELPFSDETFDRYISAGSIEYWPEPQRGINESFRVLKPGGIAVVIGPERATHWLSRAMGDLWMLFPEAEEYEQWFRAAGFEDITLHEICPERYRGIRKHGLIMGLVVRGVKRQPGEARLNLTAKLESRGMQNRGLGQRVRFLFRLAGGLIGGGYYFLLGWFLPLVALSTRRQKA